MARIAASEEQRLARLRAALGRAVAQGLFAETLKFQPMCKLLGVGRDALRDWCNEPEIAESGALIPGGNGIEYQFNPIATIWVLIRFFERKIEKRVRDNLKMREAVAGDSLDAVPAEMTLRDAREALALRLQLIEAEKQAGELVSRAEVEAAFHSLSVAMREALLSAPQKLDPTNEWSPEFREKFDNVLAELMVQLRQAGQIALSAENGLDAASSAGTGESPAKPVRAPRRDRSRRAGTAATA